MREYIAAVVECIYPVFSAAMLLPLLIASGASNGALASETRLEAGILFSTGNINLRGAAAVLHFFLFRQLYIQLCYVNFL